ncbi:MAG: hypothetical protein EA341_00535 [Mongoliibacter sp.]|uniref:hypothetical protein n=1 Tax=Mongoliibacter sp. TaxID=2022438 RepID=UPI0012F053BD|nr:hypothetical protein [Mongoliibacter sp.]TVP53920.1 MAG: hypothetical protein EA341_00535 [Mongoliibacter sp.]
MLRKSFENIDQRAKIPEGIEFRREEVWAKIQSKPKRKPIGWWYWSAAALIPLLLFVGWFFEPSQSEPPVYVLTSISTYSDDLIIEKPNSEEMQKQRGNTISDPKSIEKMEESSVVASSVLDSVSHESKSKQSKTLRQSIVLEDSIAEPEEGKLSPSAQAFQQALEKTKIEQKVEERMIVEKLTFEQMIQARKQYMQEKGNSTKNRKRDD